MKPIFLSHFRPEMYVLPEISTKELLSWMKEICQDPWESKSQHVQNMSKTDFSNSWTDKIQSYREKWTWNNQNYI